MSAYGIVLWGEAARVQELLAAAGVDVDQIRTLV